MLSAINACGVCSTHKRPADVPWHQHVVGCPIRAGALEVNIGTRAAAPAVVPCAVRSRAPRGRLISLALRAF
jgi:hypothetical protein